ncbi:hypothetical protein DFH06DRAFT_1318176 [Mycena polygramma]|nr:hypothetical protein DFH06DRAFT_1318176 [Mycena polygramma]
MFLTDEQSLWPFVVFDILALSLSLHVRWVGRIPGRFNLFGGCDPIKSMYTPSEIIFGRSSLRPLVRGESRAIAHFRAIILLSLCLVIPTFGGYISLVVPFQANAVSTRTIKVARPWTAPQVGGGFLRNDLLTENIVILLLYVNNPYNPDLNSEVNVTIAKENPRILCGNSSIRLFESAAMTVMCSFPWTDTAHPANSAHSLTISANFSDSGAGGTLYVKPGQGDPVDVDSYAEVIPLTTGSHLSAYLSRTERDLFSNNAQDILGITTPYRQILLTPVLHLQADPFPPVENNVSLRLRMRDDLDPTLSAPQMVRDFTDSSVLNGLATAGGFWTFVNGTFAMVFGANILYFLFGRRSLSALGIVHIFQRRKLTQNWNEDFPALHTEGGLPGSRSAGIVAFLRERLVDLDDKDNAHGDLESQIPAAVHEN